MPIKKKIELAISGAGTTAGAEVGAVTCLYYHGIVPSFLVGTSAGSIVSALLSIGHSPADLKTIVFGADYKKLIPYNYFNFLRGYLASNRNVIAWLKEITGGLKMADCRVPLITISSDLCTGGVRAFDSRSSEDKELFLWEVVLASMSIPDIFPPYLNRYVDGGLMDNLGINYLPGVEKGLGLKCGSKIQYRPPSSFTMFNRQPRLMNMALSAEEATVAALSKVTGVPIVDLSTGAFNFLDRTLTLGDKKDLYALGYSCTESFLSKNSSF